MAGWEKAVAVLIVRLRWQDSLDSQKNRIDDDKEILSNFLDSCLVWIFNGANKLTKLVLMQSNVILSYRF